MRKARIALLPLALAACSGTAAESAGPVVREENGVRIVENLTLDVDSTSWQFDSVPAAVIGVADGPDEYVIGRLAGFLRRTDGSILIGDAISQKVRLYSAEGRFLRAVGGNGDGPGEYRVLRSVAPHPGDSVLVIDYEGGRGTVLDPQLEYVRSFQLMLQDGREDSSHDAVADVSGDGHLLIYDYLNTCGSARSNGFCEDSMVLYRTDVHGVPVSSLGRFVYDRDETVSTPGNGLFSWGEPHPQVFRRTLGSRTYYADSKRFEVLVFDSTGKLETVIRAPYQQRSYARSELWPLRFPDTAGDPRLAALQRTATEAYRAAAIPDSLPQFSDMLVDADGSVWLAEYLAPGTTRPDMRPRWYVFTADGTLAHIVRAPRDLRGHPVPWLRSHAQVGDDFALTTRRDADGVESVVLYRLTKK